MSLTTTTDWTPENLKVSYGRGMNSETYKLPSDKPEMDRLSLQHRIWTLMADGLYPREAEGDVQRVIKKALAERRTPKILDIGSGSGSWAVEMALKFPWANVVGIDLAPYKPPFVPANCRFIKSDAVVNLHEYVSQFDIVQCRSVAKHVPSAKSLTSSIGKALKPGGIFIFADAITEDVYQPTLHRFERAELEKSYEENSNRTYFGLWMYEVSKRWLSKGLENTDGDKLAILMKEDGQFCNVRTRTYDIPIGWDGAGIVDNQNGAEIGRLMVLNVLDFTQSSKPSLLASGLPEALVNQWESIVRREANDLVKRQVMKWCIHWATKSDRVLANL